MLRWSSEKLTATFTTFRSSSGKVTPPEVPAMLFKRSLRDHVMGSQ